MNELILKQESVEIEQGVIMFNQYEQLKSQAEEIASYIVQVEVNEENIKQSKKLVANAQKIVKALESRRVDIKKKMLEPYCIFESQIKEIAGIVNEADETVRKQIKDMEEIERGYKLLAIEEIWNKRVKAYDNDLIKFDNFIKPQHLNKTMSLKKVEEDMTEWLEKTYNELQIIKTMNYSDEIMAEYVDCGDMIRAVQSVTQRKEREQTVKSVNKTYKYTFTIFNEKDSTLAELLLQQNNIKYEKGIL